jgi:adenine-specific DNA-methyltransferase
MEDPCYLSRQLITCIGNKRALLPEIGQAVDQVKRRLGRSKLQILDAFSGSGVVTRYLKAHARSLVANDLEDYAAAVSRCYLRNRSTVNGAAVRDAVAWLNATADRAAGGDRHRGFIEAHRTRATCAWARS